MIIRRTLILAASLFALALAGCEEQTDVTKPIDVDPQAQSAQPLDGGEAPGTLDPGSGQAPPTEMGMPGNKGGK